MQLLLVVLFAPLLWTGWIVDLLRERKAIVSEAARERAFEATWGQLFSDPGAGPDPD